MKTEDYVGHLDTLQVQAETALHEQGYDALVIHSGRTHNYFLDDYAPNFKPNPHFVHWVPFLTKDADCWLVVRPGKKPLLHIYSPNDFWHITAQAPTQAWCDAFELSLFDDRNAPLKGVTLSGRVALLAEHNLLPEAFSVEHNPKPLMDRLHFNRAVKTVWEQACIREANRIAVKGHLAAQQGFLQGKCEYQTHLDYLRATGHLESELPYNNIIALNEHAAVLHYQHKARALPQTHRTLLVDAGAVHHGYVADITRTIAQGSSVFDALIAGLDQAQQTLMQTIKPGVSFVDLHRAMHQAIYGLLKAHGIVQSHVNHDLADQVRISSAFFPHGLGHLLGIQVHDIGGWQHSAGGEIVAPPPEHPFLRLTRVLEQGFVVTIEPGLYFIPALLQPLKTTALGKDLDWALVDALTPWGGIRIEDNICVTAQGIENYTRDAFMLH